MTKIKDIKIRLLIVASAFTIVLSSLSILLNLSSNKPGYEEKSINVDSPFGRMDISEIKNGMYIFKMYTNKGAVSQLIIKQ